MSNYKIVPSQPVKVFLWIPTCVYSSRYERDKWRWLRHVWVYNLECYTSYESAMAAFNEDCAWDKGIDKELGRDLSSISKAIDDMLSNENNKPHYKYNWKLNKAELIK